MTPAEIRAEIRSWPWLLPVLLFWIGLWVITPGDASDEARAAGASHPSPQAVSATGSIPIAGEE